MAVSPEELEDIPLFALLDDAERAVLAAEVEEISLTAGEHLFRYGDPGDRMYVLKSGAVELWLTNTTGERVTLERVHEGGFFGEISLLDQGPRTASATVEESGRAICVDRNDLARLIALKPSAAMDLLTATGQRLRESSARLRNTATRNVNEEHDETSGWLLRVADRVAAFSGSISFLLLHLVVFSLWLALNLEVLPQPFDPYPFGLLTMAVSLESIILSTLLLFSSNREAARDRVRNDIEYEVNLKAELQIQQLHEKFDEMNAELLARLERLENGAHPRKSQS